MAKYDQLYNLDSFKNLRNQVNEGFAKAMKDAMPNGIILSRSLEYLDPKILEQQYPGITYLNTGVSVDNSGGYHRFITKRKRSIAGEFMNASDDASNKGKITLYGEDEQLRVHSYYAHSRWTDTEVHEAMSENIDLIGGFVSATNEIYQRDTDQIFYIGKGSIREGLDNYSGFTADTASDTIQNMTGVQTYSEFATFISKQWAEAQNIPAYMANVVVMPIAVYNFISSKSYGTNENPDSVLTVLRKNFPNVNFMPSFRATRVTAFSNTEEAMILRIPQPLEFSETLIKHFTRSFASRFRIAGLDVSENIAGRHLDGLL